MNLDFNRQIRVFISSTFSDMQSERDYLIKKVFPHLQVEAAKRNVSIIPLDLRWGVTEEESRSGKVIQVCLQEIENSRPFFIGLVGNRYGWCPTREELQKNEILRERWGHWLEKDISEGLSVTEIEMQYGVLRSKDKLDACFFLKNGGHDDLENIDKLERLRKTVRNNGRYPVSDYTTPESLGRKVEEMFMKLLEDRFPIDDFSEYEKERVANEAFLHSRIMSYIPKDENIRAIDNFLNNPNQHYLVITGSSGSGKSALFANWIKHNKNTAYNVIYHFIGNGMQRSNPYHIINYICEGIRKLYQLPDGQDDDKKGVKETLDNILNHIHGRKPLLIILDGMDQIVDIDNAKLLNWLPYLHEGVKLLFSTVSEDMSYQSFVFRQYPMYSLVPLDKQDRVLFIREYLEKYGRRLTDQQMDTIASDRQSENMLVLKTMIDELLSYGVHERLNEQIDYYLKPNSIDGFFQAVLERNEKDYSDKFVEKVLSLIAFSRSGLQESEIMEMTSANQLQWSQFYCAFHNNLIVRGGLLTFSHHYIADTVKVRYADKEEQCRKTIVGYFGGDKTKRSMYEIPYQLYRLKGFDMLYSLLLIPDVFQYFYITDRMALAEFWRELREMDRLRYRLSAYVYGKHDYKLEDYFKTPSKLAEYYYEIANFVGDFFADYQLVLECYRRSLDLTTNNETIENATILNNMGHVYSLMARYSEAIGAHNKALAIRLRLLGSNHPQVAQSYGNLGYVYDKQGRYDEALLYFRKSLEINQKLVIKDGGVGVANDYNNIGHVLTNKGRLQEGLDYQKKALSIRQIVLGDNNFDTAMSYHNIGAVLFLLGRLQEALPNLRKASEIWVAILGERHPQVATGWHDLGCLYRQRGQFEIAMELMEKALNIRVKTIDEDHPDTVNSYNTLADLCFQVQDYKKSKAYYSKLYEIVSRHSERHDLNYSAQILTLGGIGMSNCMLGEYEEGEKYLTKAIELCKKYTPENKQLLLGLMNNLFAIKIRREQGLNPDEKLRISIDIKK